MLMLSRAVSGMFKGCFRDVNFGVFESILSIILPIYALKYSNSCVPFFDTPFPTCLLLVPFFPRWFRLSFV